MIDAWTKDILGVSVLSSIQAGDVAQLVEYFIGNEEVSGSSPDIPTTISLRKQDYYKNN